MAWIEYGVIDLAPVPGHILNRRGKCRPGSGWPVSRWLPPACPPGWAAASPAG